MLLGPSYAIYRSGGALFWSLLILGAILVWIALVIATIAKRVSVDSCDRVGVLAGVLGLLAWLDFVLMGSWWRVYPHRMVYEELLFTLACYIPVREASSLKWLSFGVLGAVWLGLILAAADQVAFWGVGRFVFLDMLLVSAVVMPAGLGLARRGRRTRA